MALAEHKTKAFKSENQWLIKNEGLSKPDGIVSTETMINSSFDNSYPV